MARPFRLIDVMGTSHRRRKQHDPHYRVGPVTHPHSLSSTYGIVLGYPGDRIPAGWQHLSTTISIRGSVIHYRYGTFS